MMETFTMQYLLWSLLLGGLSNVSFLIGSGLGIFWNPRSSITAGLTAFGAGALLAALSVELIAPTVHGGHGGSDSGAAHVSPAGQLLALLAGCVAGGLVFTVLDNMLNSHGGYLRKAATTINYLSKRHRERIRNLLDRLAQVEFFRSIPPDQVQRLVDYVRPVRFEARQQLFDEGDEGDRMYFIEKGEIILSRGGEEFTRLRAGEILGEIALLTGAPRTAKAVAGSSTVMFELLKEDFDKLNRMIPALEAAATRIASERLEELRERQDHSSEAASQWARAAGRSLQKTSIPTLKEVQEAAAEHGGAPLSIWLGMLLDGVPECFVLGASFLALITAKMDSGAPVFSELIPYTLIAGLFLSNLPESMSSSIGMRGQGWKSSKIFLIWLSLVALTTLFTGFGYVASASVDPILIIGIEGLAAGAMLTMVAQTMIPESVHLGGSGVVGLSTLIGFLSAVAFKLLEM